MKKLIFSSSVLFILFPGLVKAWDHGLYFGLGSGYASLGMPTGTAFVVSDNGSASSRKLNGIPGRVFLGLKYWHYLGLEVGYTVFPESRYQASQDNMNSKLTYTGNAADIVGKVYLPIQNCRDYTINLYAIGGFSHFRQQINFYDGGIPINSNNFTTPKDGTTVVSKDRPIYGLGINYEVCSVSFSLEYTHTQSSGDFKWDRNAIPSVDIVLLNFAYNFG